jgi:inositol-pentakisphosphate 2-kinase
MRVPVTRDFLECVEKNVIKQRPAWRIDVSVVDLERDFVIIMSDHSLFPGGNHCHFEVFFLYTT